MHKAIALQQNHNGRNNMTSCPDVGSAKWKHLTEADVPKPNLNSTELAYRRYLKTGSWPYGNGFTRPSATRFDSEEPEDDEEVGDEDGEGDEDMEEDEDERTPERDVQRMPGSEGRLGNEVNHHNHDRQNGSSYSDDYEESNIDESDNEYENHRPRAAVSDIRSSNSSNVDIKPREDFHRTLSNNGNNEMKYTPNVHPYLPSVRILRPSQDLSGPGSGARLPEFSSDVQACRKPSPASQEKKAAPPLRAAKPAPPPRSIPQAKRKREVSLSDDDDDEEPSSKVPKLPRPRKGGNGGQSGFKRKEYKCDMCANFYAGSKGDLKRHHESLTHKPPSYRCEVEPCDKMFTRMDAVKRHMKNAHNYVAPVDPDTDSKKASSSKSKSRSRSPQSAQ